MCVTFTVRNETDKKFTAYIITMAKAIYRFQY